jgi:hypothetical protein
VYSAAQYTDNHRNVAMAFLISYHATNSSGANLNP